MIRTNIDEVTKVYVMENEVTLTALSDLEVQEVPTKRRKRFEALCEDKDAEIIDLLDKLKTDEDPLSYIKIWRTISRMSDDVREHLVSGKPLKVKRPYKKAA